MQQYIRSYSSIKIRVNLEETLVIVMILVDFLFNMYMPRKRQTGTVRRRRHQGGSLKDIFGKVNRFLKEHKLISRGAAALAPHAGTFGPLVGKIGSVAGALGYGKRRPRRRRRRPRM